MRRRSSFGQLRKYIEFRRRRGGGGGGEGGGGGRRRGILLYSRRRSRPRDGRAPPNCIRLHRPSKMLQMNPGPTDCELDILAHDVLFRNAEQKTGAKPTTTRTCQGICGGLASTLIPLIISYSIYRGVGSCWTDGVMETHSAVQ